MSGDHVDHFKKTRQRHRGGLVAALAIGLLIHAKAVQAQTADPLVDPAAREILAEAAATAAGQNRPQDIPSLTVPPIIGVPAKSAAREGVLLLVDGRVLGGTIEEVAGGYLLKKGRGASETIPAFLVRLSADSLDAAYEKLRDSNRNARPDDHISLADWCMQQGLYEYARDELAEALRLDPRRRDARMLLMKVEEKLNPHPVHRDSEEGENRTSDQFLTPLPVTTADLKPETRAIFVRQIQPLMMNKCNNVRCHGTKTQSGFELIAVRSGSAPRASTHENLTRVVERIDIASPESSPLLEALASEAHNRVFLGRAGNLQINALRDWIATASADLTAVHADTNAAEVEQASLSFSDRIRAADTTPVPLQRMEQPPALAATPALTATPDQRLVRQVLLEERPDPFDPDAFNRAMHREEAPPLR